MREAKTYQTRCDWPQCTAAVDIDQADYYNDIDGWTKFPGGLDVTGGLWIADLCPAHGTVTLDRLAREAESKRAEETARLRGDVSR